MKIIIHFLNILQEIITKLIKQKGLLPDKYGKQCKSEAIKYFKKAAENGLDDAMVKLGRMYEIGDEVHSNKEKAYALYKEASKKV